jgi:hypothetical protein
MRRTTEWEDIRVDGLSLALEGSWYSTSARSQGRCSASRGRSTLSNVSPMRLKLSEEVPNGENTASIPGT